jgi:4-hydroxy-3-polyprenylbenzoate decarboxylase
MADLRDFLRRLEAEGELRRIRQPVDLKYEIGAVCFSELQKGIHRNQALLFENIGGAAAPLAVNLLASPKRFFTALDLASPRRWHRFWLEKTSSPLKPLLVENAPCQEVICDDARLDRFPIPLWNEKDGGPYLTMACVISKDPETGQRNCAIYRMMVHEDGRSAGILAPPYRHIAAHLARSSARRESLPVAVAIGVSPALMIAAAGDFPYGVDEIAMAGALEGAPVEVARCRTVPLEVPAHAEVVLEGSITPGDEKKEGPFGEFTGYYSGESACRPVFRIGCISHRRDPIAVGSYVGPPPQENALINALTTEAEILRQCPLPGMLDIQIHPLGVLNATVSIDGKHAANARRIAHGILATPAGRRIKSLTLVDEDIDPRDHDQVSWALAYRVRPERDVEIVNDRIGVTVDPSLPREERLSGTARTSKMIIDATKRDAEWTAEECRPKPEVLERVKREWGKYS